MTSRQTVERYFADLQSGGDWERHMDDGVAFTNHAAPPRSVSGRRAFTEATRGFYGMIASVEVRRLFADGDAVCALTTYELRPPVGAPFTSDVAEVFTVADGKVTAFSIYFDSAPYPS